MEWTLYPAVYQNLDQLSKLPQARENYSELSTII